MMKSFLLFIVLTAAQLFAQSGGLVNGTRGFPQPNDGTTGTTVNTTAVVNSSGNAIAAAVTDTSTPTYVVVGGAGITGNAVLASNGSLAPCKMDATVGSGAGGFYVVNSTTVAKDCHAQSTSPSSGVWVIGFLHDSNTTAGANSLVAISGFVFGSSAGVSSFTGDGSLANNAGSTGAVTLTLAQAAAHKIWMNNTGSLAAPGYQSLGVADLPTGIPNANLSNSSLTLSTSAPLGGGGLVSLGGTLTLTCTTCITDFSAGTSAKVANYTLASVDDGKLVTFSGASLTATLPATPPSATWSATILNLASTNVTISRNALQINSGTSNPSLPQFQALRVWTDGTNYFTDSVPTAVSAPITLAATSAGISIGCNTCGVTSSGLNQFAATTSAQLAVVLSDELGSGKVVFATSLQGTDANVFTAGTVTGTGATLCTDANGGATTTGCTSATPMTTLGDIIYENATPAPARLAGPTTPNGVPEVLTSIPSAGAAVAPTWSLPGIAGRAITGTTATDTIVSADCSPKRVEYVGSVAVAVTLPTATTLAVANCVFKITNNLSTLNDVTVTPTTWTVNGGASAAIHQGQVATLYVDPNSATNWVADITEQGLTAGTNITFTRSATGLSVAASGGGTPCTVTALSLQFNNAGAFGCVTPFTFSSNTITSAAAGILDLSAATGASAFKVPVQAGATAASDGVINYDSTAKITHIRTNAADSDVLATTTTDTTTTHAVFASATAGLYTSRAIAAGDLPAIPLSGLATQAANTIVANVTGSTALPIAVAVPGCSTDIFSNVNYTSGTGFGCNLIVLSAINPQTTTYQVLASDFSLYKTITVASGTFTITLVASGSQPAAGKYINILNYGSGTVTVARSGQNINGAAANLTLNPGSASAPTSTTVSSNGTDYVAAIDEGTLGTVTSVATTSPITGGTITSTGTIGCATCVTSVAALTNNALVIGGGLQASSTIAASTTTTQALFATATAPAFRAIVAGDLPSIPINQVISATGAIATIADGNNPLVINCALTSGTTCQTLGETTAATTAGAVELQISTLTTSTAIPLQITQGAAGPANAAAPNLINISAAASGGAASASNAGSAGAAISLLTGAGSAGGATTGVGGNGGAFTLTEGAGGNAGGTATNNGGTGGGFSLTKGAGGNGGTGAATAGSGGAITFTLGAPGTNSATGTAGAVGLLNVTGNAPASTVNATGVNAGTLFSISGVTGGADSNAAGTAGVGSSPSITAGNGGAGTGTNTVGGAGGTITETAGNGGVSLGTGANANGGGFTFNLGQPGTGGSGTVGKTGIFQTADSGGHAGFWGCTQGTANTTSNTAIPANSIFFQCPTSVTAYGATMPTAGPTNTNSAMLFSNAVPSVITFAKQSQALFLTSLYTNATTTFSNVTGLSFSAEASTNYTVECNLDYQASATTADVKIQWTGPASPTFLTYDMISEVTASTLSSSVNPATATTTGAFSTSLSEAGTPTTATNFPLKLSMTLINGANAGTVQLQAAAVGTGTVSILPGSCQVQ